MYVGQTTDLVVRKKRHASNSRKPRTYFERALNKHGMDGFTWEVVDQADTLEELDLHEKHWIKLHDTTDLTKGYNLTDGGWSNRNCTPECRKIMSDAAKKKFADGYVHHSKDKPALPHVIAASQAGLKAARERNGHPMQGKHQSEEAKHRISEIRKEQGYCGPTKRVHCIELDIIFPSLQAAARHVGKNAGGLCELLKGRSKQSTWAGYTWQYAVTTPQPSVLT